MADTNLELELQLNNIAELFQAPELDPLNGVFDERSGVERIYDEIRANSSARAVSVVLHVPAENAADLSEAQVRTALAGYCNAQIQQLSRSQLPVRRLGIRSTVFGLIFVGGGLLLSFAFSGTLNIPPFLGYFLIEGFLIAGWVALWYATEVWLFEIREKRSERQAYERLQNISLQIKSPVTPTTKI